MSVSIIDKSSCDKKCSHPQRFSFDIIKYHHLPSCLLRSFLGKSIIIKVRIGMRSHISNRWYQNGNGQDQAYKSTKHPTMLCVLKEIERYGKEQQQGTSHIEGHALDISASCECDRENHDVRCSHNQNESMRQRRPSRFESLPRTYNNTNLAKTCFCNSRDFENITTTRTNYKQSRSDV